MKESLLSCYDQGRFHCLFAFSSLFFLVRILCILQSESLLSRYGTSLNYLPLSIMSKKLVSFTSLPVDEIRASFFFSLIELLSPNLDSSFPCLKCHNNTCVAHQSNTLLREPKGFGRFQDYSYLEPADTCSIN